MHGQRQEVVHPLPIALRFRGLGLHVLEVQLFLQELSKGKFFVRSATSG